MKVLIETNKENMPNSNKKPCNIEKNQNFMIENDENCYFKNDFVAFTKNISEILQLDSNEFSQEEILQRFLSILIKIS